MLHSIAEFLFLYVMFSLITGVPVSAIVELKPLHEVSVIVLWPISVPALATYGLYSLYTDVKDERQIEKAKNQARLEVAYKKAIKELEE